jgi:hypothetical protein
MPMNLWLISDSDGRVLAIRDHVLPLLRQRGNVQLQRDTVRVTELQMGPWALRHWTPFNELGQDEASSPGYRHAVERQRSRRTLPYGLDIWHGNELAKVLSVLWADDGRIEVMSFVRGPWEEEALAL